MTKYKITYSQVVSYTETINTTSFGFPIIKYKNHVNEVLDGYEELGFKTYQEAKKRAEILKNISNKKYININIESYK